MTDIRQESSISGRIRHLLEVRCMTQLRLSEICQIPYGTIHRYCSKNIIPRKQHLEQIAQALGVTPEYIQYGDKNGDRDMKQEIITLLIDMSFSQKQELINTIRASMGEKGDEENADADR